MSIFKIAENLLNNLDQSAQTSIQTALNKTPNSQRKINRHKNNQLLNDPNQVTTTSRSTTPLSTISASSSTTNLKHNDSSSSLNIDSNRNFKLSINKEDELIEFLNNSQKIEVSNLENGNLFLIFSFFLLY
jgi:hypothetical protein